MHFTTTEKVSMHSLETNTPSQYYTSPPYEHGLSLPIYPVNTHTLALLWLRDCTVSYFPTHRSTFLLSPRFCTLIVPSFCTGYCVFSDIAVAANIALTEFAPTVKKIVIIDLDVHQGEGQVGIRVRVRVRVRARSQGQGSIISPYVPSCVRSYSLSS